MTTRDFFVMIKPDGVRRGLIGTIIGRFESRGFGVIDLKMITPSARLITEHYEIHKGKTFFDNLIKFSTSGPVVAMRLHGNIDVARKEVGATIPWSAKKGTIRGDFANSLPDNLVHCSDTEESATKEIELWFPDTSDSEEEIDIYRHWT